MRCEPGTADPGLRRAQCCVVCVCPAPAPDPPPAITLRLQEARKGAGTGGDGGVKRDKHHHRGSRKKAKVADKVVKQAEVGVGEKMLPIVTAPAAGEQAAPSPEEAAGQRSESAADAERLPAADTSPPENGDATLADSDADVSRHSPPCSDTENNNTIPADDVEKVCLTTVAFAIPLSRVGPEKIKKKTKNKA